MSKRQKIIALLTENEEGQTARDITDRLYGRNKHQSIVFSELQRMENEGIIYRVNGNQPFIFVLKNKLATNLSPIKSEASIMATKVEEKQASILSLVPLVRSHAASNSPIAEAIKLFFEVFISNRIEVYNEFSLQHELGFFLRGKLPDYKVQFERNVSFFSINRSTIKKEIDIAVFKPDYSERYAIELKAPRNGQYPEQLFSFSKDIKFMEELKQEGFTNTYAVTLVADPAFYEGRLDDGIYRYYRSEHNVYGEINKPTGKKDETICLEGVYPIEWERLSDGRRYYIVEL